MFIKQYELWQTCNNNCIFCFNKNLVSTLNPKQQVQSLNFVIQDLDKEIASHPSDLCLELIGGEFFQGQLSTIEVREAFFKLIEKINLLGKQGLLKQLCLFCTLTYGEQKDLYKTLEYFKDTPLDLWVSTSYDTKGRFNTDKQLKNWKHQMLKLSSVKNLHLNTTMIFTQDFCDKVLSGALDLKSFQETYKTTLFFKHPLPPLVTSYYTKDLLDSKSFFFQQKEQYKKENPWFFPTRKDALKVMSILKELNILDRFMGLEYRADDLDSKFDSEKGFQKTLRDKKHNIESKTEDKSFCGHLLTYSCYSDSNRCILCDKENLLDY